MPLDEPPDRPDKKKIQETAARLWLAQYVGGPFDGHTDVWEHQLRRRVTRTWYRANGSKLLCFYQLLEPVRGGLVHYLFVDSADPPKPNPE